MTTQQPPPVVGAFVNRVQANEALTKLDEANFGEEDIGVAMRHSDGTVTEKDTQAGSGALTGALAGLGLGALAGLGVLAGVIPVVGPAIAAGTLGVIVSNATAGAGIAGLVGALAGAGVSEHEANYYQGEFEAGRVIVTVHAGSRSAEATMILEQCGAHFLSRRQPAEGPT